MEYCKHNCHERSLLLFVDDQFTMRPNVLNARSLPDLKPRDKLMDEFILFLNSQVLLGTSITPE